MEGACISREIGYYGTCMIGHYEGLLWLCYYGYYEALKVESVVVFIIELGIWVVRASGKSTREGPTFRRW